MTTYQSVLPGATRQLCSKERTRERHVARQLKDRLAQVFANGFHFCHDCQARCERVEGENGQPASCDRCGSSHIDWNPPVWLTEPGDLVGKEGT